MYKIIRQCVFVLLLILQVIVLQCSYAAITPDKIIVFGDSLSDNGNIYSLTSTAHEVSSAIPIIPKEPPYYLGRFTNGPVWIEHVALALNAPLVDYAYGGAWVESFYDSKQIIPFGLGMQVNMYLVKSVTDFHKDKHLYVIWAGANDYAQGRTDLEYATTNTVASIQSQIDWLAYYGAKHFLILNLPDLSLVPEVIAKGPEFSAMISKLSQMHNTKLIAAMEKLKQEYVDVDFKMVDITDYFNNITTHPEQYQLKNVTDACYGGGFYFSSKLVNNEEIEAAAKANIHILNNVSLSTAYYVSKAYSLGEKPCDNPDEYLYWDRIHPTRVIHQMLALFVLNALDKS